MSSGRVTLAAALLAFQSRGYVIASLVLYLAKIRLFCVA
jgi:hypothetical protein